MKGSIIIFVSLFVFLSACNQSETDNESIVIPEKIINEFTKDFPNASSVEWEFEDGYYEAEYESNGIEHTIVYDEEGNVYMTEVEIEIDDLPDGVINYFNEHFSGHEIEEAESIQIDNVGYFEIEFENGNEEIELLFDEDGNYVSQEIEVEEEHED